MASSKKTVIEYLAYRGYVGMAFFDELREHLYLVQGMSQHKRLKTLDYNLQNGDRSFCTKFNLPEIFSLQTASEKELALARQGKLHPIIVGHEHKKLGHSYDALPTHYSHHKPHKK